MDKAVRCVHCGLLGLREEKTWRLVEVEERCREKGRVAVSHRIEPILCSAQKRTFSKIPDDWSKELNEERDCPAFIPWCPGFTPKEHTEMARAQELLAREQAREDADHRWREEQAAKQRKWQQEQAGLAQRWRQEDLRHLKNDMRIKALAPVVAVIVGTFLGWYLRGESASAHQPQPPPAVTPNQAVSEFEDRQAGKKATADTPRSESGRKVIGAQ
ncbi:MAG: hypothetical protein ACYC35_01440 [Pirellulales bacterium]